MAPDRTHIVYGTRREQEADAFKLRQCLPHGLKSHGCLAVRQNTFKKTVSLQAVREGEERERERNRVRLVRVQRSEEVCLRAGTGCGSCSCVVVNCFVHGECVCTYIYTHNV